MYASDYAIDLERQVYVLEREAAALEREIHRLEVENTRLAVELEAIKALRHCEGEYPWHCAVCEQVHKLKLNKQSVKKRQLILLCIQHCCKT